MIKKIQNALREQVHSRRATAKYDSCEEEPPIERSDDEEKLPETPKAQKKQGNKGKKRHEKYAKEANQAHTHKCAIRPCV